MSLKPLTSTIRDIQTLFHIGHVGDWSDARLLHHFRSHSGPEAEAAFSMLVSRHGPMVLRVCRGVLNDEHDAQDAFQATFLVLVRKAGSVRKQSSVASWLHGVAHRVASRARVDAIRRRAHERRMATMIKESRTDAAGNGVVGTTADLDIIDEEIRRLPEKYRAVVVLCYLEGLTQEQAAGQLGWPSGTVRGRLSRARMLLRSSLARRGLALPAGAAVAGAGVAPSDAWASAVPASLIDATVSSAMSLAGKASGVVVPATVAALTEGTVRALSYSRLKPIALIVAGLVTTSGATYTQFAPGTLARSSSVAGSESTSSTANKRALAIRQALARLAPNRERATVAFPLKGIVIDGELNDWPSNIERQPIDESNGQGRRNREMATLGEPSGPQSTFSVGYDPKKQQIYLAVVVRDAYPVVDHHDAWHTDACEVFVDGLRTERNTNGSLDGMNWGQKLSAETMPALQYVGVPGKGAAFGDPRGFNPCLMYGNNAKTRTVMAWSRKGDTTTYEWAIEAFDQYPDQPTLLEPGKRIGFDIAIVDQNIGPDTFINNLLVPHDLPTYTCWSPWAKTFKGCDASSLGDLIFAADPP